MPGQSLQGQNSYILFAIFNPFFGLSTKFGHSIPQPLNLDGHSVKHPLGALHTMDLGQEAVDFHQLNYKKPRVWPLDPSHYGQSPKAVATGKSLHSQVEHHV
jgi:hypothetical protein